MSEGPEARNGRHLVAVGSGEGRQRTTVAVVPLDRLRPNPKQPRRHFDEAALRELAESIRTRGLIHPIVVRPEEGSEHLLILAGERRFRAARIAGLDRVPVLVRRDDPLEIALIENLQRENLTPLEEAEGLARLAAQFGYTHEELAALVGKSRPYVSNTLALCRLPEEIKRECHERPGVSREVLIGIAREKSPERQQLLWHLARLRHPTVRAFRAETGTTRPSSSDVEEVRRRLRRALRRLRAIDLTALSAAERDQLRRTLRRAQGAIVRALGELAEEEVRARRGHDAGSGAVGPAPGEGPAYLAAVRRGGSVRSDG